ncbi:MAG: sigma 54-interacting transcriptional regulator, partial [Planctomycetes bacterium]|nr:sigma 54-interacting transcriptional regulator [Planctomycetota bacterium]
MLRLTITDTNRAQRIFESDDPVVVVGRATGCTVVLADPEVAERHCQIERTSDGHYKLVDLESATGTEVNGVRANVQILEDGDRLWLGRSTILIETSGDASEQRTDRVPVLRPRRRRARLPRRRRIVLPRREPKEKVFSLDDLKVVLDSLVEEQGPQALDGVREALDQLYEEHKGSPLFESLEQERDTLMRMLQISKLLTGERNLKRLLDVIVDSVIELTGAERGFLILREDAAVAVKVARNFDREAVRKPEFKVSRTIAEEVLRTGKPIISADAINDPSLPAAGSVADLKLRSLLCMPFTLRDTVIGCVYIDNRFETGVFMESDLPLLQGFAELAAIAIENTRLFEENLRKQEELARSREEVERLNQQLREKVERQYVELAKVKQDLLSSQKTVELKHDFSAIIGKSRAMREVLMLLDRLIDTDEPVFIYGESGTGKELVARAIHYNSKRAKTGKLMSENVSAIPDTLLESELFGHERGAFTGAIATKQGLFELAHRGTLFLDEIGDMSLEMQTKLLRALQEGEIRRVGGKDVITVDCRIISASNKDLRQLIKDGQFREDLFYRLNVVQINLPPL